MESSNNSCSFPWRLHSVLKDADKKGFTNIISWLPSGLGFKIHNKEDFELHVMQRYFTTVKYRSFQRQLQIYGFKRANKGEEKGAYVHPAFVRNNPQLCKHMVRTKIKNKETESVRLPADNVTECDDMGHYEPIPIETNVARTICHTSTTPLLVSNEIARTIDPTIADEIINIFAHDIHRI